MCDVGQHHLKTLLACGSTETTRNESVLTVEHDDKRARSTTVRDRNRPLRVVVSTVERAEIETRAQSANLTVSSYLRTLGIGYQPKSKLDQFAVLSLVKVAADQGRLGGLLKLWLSDKPGEGATTIDVRQLLREIEDAQIELRQIVRQLSGRGA